MDSSHRDKFLPPTFRGPAWPRPSESSLTYLPESYGDEQRAQASRLGMMFRRQRWVILGTCALVVAAAAVFTSFMPRIYESSATVLIEPPQRDQTNQSTLEVLERVGRANSMETEIELVTSRRVVEPVVDELDLHATALTAAGPTRPHLVFAGFSAAAEAAPGSYQVVPQPRGGYQVEDAESGKPVARAAADSADVTFAGITIGGLRDGRREPVTLQVRSFLAAVGGTRGRVSAGPVSRQADLVAITCVAGTPADAQSLCQAVSNNYMQLRSDLRRSEATAAAQFLGEQANLVGSRLREAENQLGTYQRENMAVALDERATSEVMQQAQLRAQRDQLETERAALRQLLSATNTGQYRDLASYPSFLKNQNQVVASLVQNLVQLENRRAELAVTRTERNPDLAAVDSRIAETENQLRSFATNYEQALSTQIGSLDAAVGRAGGRVTAIPMKQVETARLQRQVSLLEDLYTYLQTRLREAEVAEAVNLPSVRIVDNPSLPLRPARPNVPLNIMLGLLLGLVFGVTIGVYREHTDSRIHERKDAERETGVPVISMIPALKRPGPILPLAETNGRGEPGSTALPPGENGHGKGVVRRTTKLSWEEEIVLEAFRSLAADLKFSGQSLKSGTLRSVAVTSPGRGDGKTFTACNLAIARASQGERTLLIDADLRASGVARFFGLPWTTHGLTDVLTGRRDPASVEKEMDVSEGVPLRVMASGDPNNRTTSMLERHAEEMSTVLDYARENFDMVVLDTPPLNVLTDAATIAAQVDAVIVVVRGGVTDRSALELTLERLRRANARVVGLVLNDVDLPDYYTSYSHDFAAEVSS